MVGSSDIHRVGGHAQRLHTGMDALMHCQPRRWKECTLGAAVRSAPCAEPRQASRADHAAEVRLVPEVPVGDQGASEAETLDTAFLL